MEGKEYYQFLLNRYLNGLATAPEQEELFSELQKRKDDKEWEGLLQELFINHQKTTEYDEAKWEPAIEKILERGKQKKGLVRTMPSWIKMSAAAIFILTLGTAIFLLVNKPKIGSPEIASSPKKNILNDIAPGGDKAILTLADGSKIVLDSAANGALTHQGGVKVIKIGGQLTYSAEVNSTEVLYNIIATPNGGQYQLELADGSKVWLNAASSLRFPTAFTGSERTVELRGEGYFEIAHNPSKPFTVLVDGMNVEVLGTHFNINAYHDESLSKTTLLQGKVKVTKAEKSVILEPGQQARSYYDGSRENTIVVDKNIDVDAVVAWKNGLFNFENSDIDKILREFARWYDVEVQFEGKKPTQEFFGIVSRNSTLSSVLKALKAGGPAHLGYSIVGKKLIVQSVNKN